MTLSEFVRALRDDPRFMENVTEWRVLPAREAKYAPFPRELDARIVQVLKARGLSVCIRSAAALVAPAQAGATSSSSRRRASGKNAVLITCLC